MKKILLTLITSLILFIPQVSVANSFSVPFQATTTSSTGWVFPYKVSGNYFTISAPSFVATSTTAASVFPYASSTVISVSQNSYFNTTESTTLSPQFLIGTTSIPAFVLLNNGQSDTTLTVLRQDAGTTVGYRTVLNLIEANGTNFFPADSGPQIDYSVSAGTAGVIALGRTSCAFDRPANFISGRCLFWARDSVSGLLTPFGGYDGFGAWLFGASSTEFRSAQFNFQSNTTRFTKAFEIDTGNGSATTTNAFAVLSTGLTGIGTGTPTFQLDVVGTGLYNGDTSGQFAVAAASDQRKKIYAGYDVNLGTNGSGFIQAVMSGNAYTNLLLDPNGGNVGIGTSTPSRSLDVYSTNTIAGIFAGNSGTGAVGIGATSGGAFINGYSNDSATANGTLTVQPGSGNVLIATGGGNVGISTSTPVAKVDSYTTASTTNMLLESVAGTGGCLIIKDVQGGGYTQAYSQAGVIYSKVATSLTTCN